MRSLFLQFGAGMTLWSVLLSARAVADDRLPTPLAFERRDESELPIPAITDGKTYRLRTVELDEPEIDSRRGWSIFSVPDPWMRSERHGGGVSPLISRESVALLPVRTLSIPNPLALLGNPTKWGGRFRAAYGTNFNDGRLLHGNLIVDSGLPIAFDTEANYRTDPRRVLADREFWNGDFNVIYHLKQIQYVGFRIGIGANWLTDGDRTDVGFNTTYGFDIRLKKPFYMTTTIDYGWLSSKTTLHWQITGGLDFGRFELFIGYDFFEVGSRERKNVIAGAGIWF